MSIPHGTLSGYSHHKCRCIECRQANADYMAEYRRNNAEHLAEYYRINAERISAYMAEYRSNNIERINAVKAKYNQNHRAEACERDRRRRENNPEYAAEYYQEHRERISAATAEYSRNNRENRRISDHRRRTRKLACGGSHTLVELVAQRAAQGDCCAYCGVDLSGSGHIEHMTPLSRGGSNSIGNIVWSCSTCNQRKNTKTAEEFMAATRGSNTGITQRQGTH